MNCTLSLFSVKLYIAVCPGGIIYPRGNGNAEFDRLVENKITDFLSCRAIYYYQVIVYLVPVRGKRFICGQQSREILFRRIVARTGLLTAYVESEFVLLAACKSCSDRNADKAIFILHKFIFAVHMELLMIMLLTINSDIIISLCCTRMSFTIVLKFHTAEKKNSSICSRCRI